MDWRSHNFQAYLLDKLELVQRKHLKRILFLPTSTANSAVHLSTGTLPIRATIHQRVLGFLIRIMHNPDTKEYNILTRQAAVKTEKSHCWITYIRKHLRQYKLPILYSLMNITPASSAWKLTVKRAVQHYWWTVQPANQWGKCSIIYLWNDRHMKI